MAACALAHGALAPAQEIVPRPPPQRSLDVPPIIDPRTTAVLSGYVPVRDSTEAGGGQGSTPGAGGSGNSGASGPAKPGVPSAREQTQETRRSVVWIVRPTSARTPRLPEQTIMVNAGTFAPSTVAVTPGTTIDLRTDESGVVTVIGAGLLRLERRLTRATRAIPIVTDRVGAIDLTLRSSPSAKGLIVCVDSPFLNVATADGSFRIFGLPPGRNEVRVRLPNGKILERTVDLVAGKELIVDWRKPG